MDSLATAQVVAYESGSPKPPLYYGLDPLQRFLQQPDISEICINRPGQVYVERQGVDAMEAHAIPELTLNKLGQLARLIAEYKSQAVSEGSPLLSASLPNGERVQLVTAPCCKTGQFIFSLRKPSVKDMRVDDLAEGGFFAHVDADRQKQSDIDDELKSLLADRDYQRFVVRAVQVKKNIILSGMTSSGKTTALNAIAKAIPLHERIVCIEDTDEVKPPHDNLVKLLYSKSGTAANSVTADDLLQATLRLRPDRILLSEVRGSEAFTYLESIETGHPGSLSTIHANSPEGVFKRLRLLLSKGDSGFDSKSADQYIAGVVEIVIQIAKEAGRRYIGEIYFNEVHG